MSVELQIQASTLGAITARAVQARLRATCFAPLASFYVDHADVTTPVEVIPVNAAVRLRVPLDVFIVRREDVLAAPNAVPARGAVPAGTVVVILEMTATGAVVALRCVDADLGPLGVTLGATAPAAKAAIVDAVGSPMTSDLTAALKQLGMPKPTASRVELVSGIVAIRFEPSGDAVAHLFPGFDWGMFLDGASVEQLAISKVPTNTLGSRVTSMTTAAHWRPAGSVPHVDIDYAGKAQVPDPFSGEIDGTLPCDFSLTSTITKSLRTTVHWSLHVNLGALVPGFIDNMVEDAIADAFDPTKFGGTPIADHAFALDSSLPDVSFGGARFGYASVVASPEGMTIGGPVRLSLDPGKDTLQPSVHKFGLPVRFTFCRALAKSGSGEPPKTVSLGEVSTSGKVWLEHLGKFCDVEIVSPGDWIGPYVRRPADTPELSIVIPSAVALGIIEPVRLIVRTARGVRLVDLGTPPPVTLDANGNVTNSLTIHIPNCLSVNVEHGLGWYVDHPRDPGSFAPPLEHPDWKSYLGRHRGIDVQLVTLSALEPGELIQFRSRDHAVDVTADRDGRALVPVLLPVADNQEQASLIRVNRRGIAGHFTTQTAIFVNQASIPTGLQNRLAASVDGAAVLTTEREDHVDVYEIGSLGAPMLLKRDAGRTQESDVGVLPPRDVCAPACNPLLAQRIQLPGMTSLVAAPGFPDAPIALATMTDGSILVLDLGGDGTARVAGTFTGPMGVLDVAGDWAIAVDPDRASIYRLIRG